MRENHAKLLVIIMVAATLWGTLTTSAIAAPVKIDAVMSPKDEIETIFVNHTFKNHDNQSRCFDSVCRVKQGSV